ncbi:hypothetical protein [Spiribacter onubensis]|uniref:Uncharacterized protein n=1 Tax=Spiribacter onubensis TaxID=3122420 RepID=A0ABV3S9Q7_9GAMM
MARDYVRPEIPDSLYAELTQGRQLAINPDKPDLLMALDRVQHQARKRRLRAPEVLRAWHRFTHGDRANVSIAAQTSAPEHYEWPVHVTLFQAVTITPQLTGIILDRAAIHPGQQLEWPVPDEPGSARTRRNAIVTAFWLHLSDRDILSLDAHTAAA